MQSQVLLAGDLALIEQWWEPLIRAGCDVLLTPSLREPATLEVNGARHRRGVVEKGDCRISVSPAFGPTGQSRSPLAGAHLLLVDYADRRSKAEADCICVLDQVISVLIASGARRVPRLSSGETMA